MKRRQFLNAVFGVTASGVASASTVEKVDAADKAVPKRQILAFPRPKGYTELGNGQFVVTHYRHYRTQVDKGSSSMLSIIDAQTGDIRRVGTPVDKVHSVHRPSKNNPDGYTFLLGQDGGGSVQIVDRLFNSVRTVDLDGAIVRGHAIDYKRGVLCTAVGVNKQFPTRDHWRGDFVGQISDGFLVYISLDGEEVKRHPLTGLRPHQIVECGNYFAVSIYGDVPPHHGLANEFASFQSVGGSDRLVYNMLRPGICFLDKDTLAIKRFVDLPLTGVAVHLSVDGQGKLVVMTMNERNCFGSKRGVMPYAKRDDVLLLSSETYRATYEEPMPLYEINPLTGEVKTFERSPRRMRGASGLAHDQKSKYTVGIFGASQTFMVRAPNGADRFFDSLTLGISDPRGVCSIGDSGLFAISGQNDRIVIFDPSEPEVPLHHFNVTLGAQSHLHWFAA